MNYGVCTIQNLIVTLNDTVGYLKHIETQKEPFGNVFVDSAASTTETCVGSSGASLSLVLKYPEGKATCAALWTPFVSQRSGFEDERMSGTI
jgi:hypothetical protein